MAQTPTKQSKQISPVIWDRILVVRHCLAMLHQRWLHCCRSVMFHLLSTLL